MSRQFTPPPVASGGTATGVFLLGLNSTGPFVIPPNPPSNAYQPGYGAAGATPSGASAGNVNINPFLVNSQRVVVFGNIRSGGINFLTVCISAVVPQNHFISVVFMDQSSVLYTLTTATASFNSVYTGIGFSVWTWQPGPFPNLPFFGNQSATFNW